MEKQPRCKCLACKGKTIKFSRERYAKSMEFLVSKGLITPSSINEGMAAFDEFHKEGGIPADKAA